MTTTEIIFISIIIALIFLVIYTIPNHRAMKSIIFEDKLKTHLDKPLTVKSFKKIFKRDFEPYVIYGTTTFNNKVFDFIKSDIDDIIKEGFIQDSWWNIIFLNKINGIVEEEPNEWTILTDDSSDIIISSNKISPKDLVREFYDEQFDHIQEISLEGIYKINKKTYYLSDLTTIRIFKNSIDEVDKTTIMFNFGSITETINFDNLKAAYDYLFTDDKADIRLIQKIYNSAITTFEVE